MSNKSLKIIVDLFVLLAIIFLLLKGILWLFLLNIYISVPIIVILVVYQSIIFYFEHRKCKIVVGLVYRNPYGDARSVVGISRHNFTFLISYCTINGPSGGCNYKEFYKWLKDNKGKNKSGDFNITVIHEVVQEELRPFGVSIELHESIIFVYHESIQLVTIQVSKDLVRVRASDASRDFTTLKQFEMQIYKIVEVYYMSLIKKFSYIDDTMYTLKSLSGQYMKRVGLLIFVYGDSDTAKVTIDCISFKHEQLFLISINDTILYKDMNFLLSFMKSFKTT